MLPRATLDYVADGLRADAVFPGEVGTTLKVSSSPYCDDVAGGELGHGIGCADSRPFLGFGVLCVVGWSSKEEMIGTHTEPIIAVMADVQSRSDRSKMQDPRGPMSEGAPIELEPSVSSADRGGRPFPAARTFLNSRPKRFCIDHSDTIAQAGRY